MYATRFQMLKLSHAKTSTFRTVSILSAILLHIYYQHLKFEYNFEKKKKLMIFH
jgi:hypothetical protein